MALQKGGPGARTVGGHFLAFQNKANSETSHRFSLGQLFSAAK